MMLSLQQFRKQVYGLFPILFSTGAALDVVHKGIVYEVSVRKTDKKPKLSRRKRDRVQASIKMDVCKCGNIRVNDLCLDRQCTY